MGRLMGLDHGSKTTGIAMSDPTGTIVSPFDTLFREKEGKLRAVLRRITELAEEYDIERIVLGLPLNMDGSEGERALKTREFRGLLEKRLAARGLCIPVVLWDERLSTVGADEILADAGIASSDRKQYIDRVAAALILEDYMRNSAE